MTFMATESKAASELKKLRERAHMSVRQLAMALKSAGSKYGRSASSYAYYENEYKKPYLPADLVEALGPVLANRGDPPISERQVAALAGVRGGSLWLHPDPVGETVKRPKTGKIDPDLLSEILLRITLFEQDRQMTLAPRQRAYLASRIYGRIADVPRSARPARLDAEFADIAELAALFADPGDR
jgi:transcriptional regulator with XRE-family HTH domain